MIIRVTQEDIDYTIKYRDENYATFFACTECIIARCLARELRALVLEVGTTHFYIGSNHYGIELPSEVQRQIKLFDTRQYSSLYPFEFEISDEDLIRAKRGKSTKNFPESEMV